IRNARGMEGIGERQVAVADMTFAERQPELAAAALQQNAALAGQPADVPEGADAVVVASRINELANKAVADSASLPKDQRVTVGPKLVGYDYDAAFPVLVRNLIKPHPLISWFVLAALCGAVISSLASMLNSASTIATMDLYA